MNVQVHTPPPPTPEDIKVTVEMNLTEARIIQAFVGSVNVNQYNAVRADALASEKRFLPANGYAGVEVLSLLYVALRSATEET